MIWSVNTGSDDMLPFRVETLLDVFRQLVLVTVKMVPFRLLT